MYHRGQGEAKLSCLDRKTTAARIRANGNHCSGNAHAHCRKSFFFRTNRVTQYCRANTSRIHIGNKSDLILSLALQSIYDNLGMSSRTENDDLFIHHVAQFSVTR